MNRVGIFRVDEVPPSASYGATTCSVHGSVTSRLVHPPDYSLWLVDARLETGTTLEWAAPHGDELVYVLDGSVIANDARCGLDGVVVVESGAAASVRALQPTRIIHFGSVRVEPPVDGPLGAPASEGHGVHVLDAGGILNIDAGERGGAVYYADSHCPTCRITLLRNIRPPESRIPSHLHSQDELVYLLSGDAQLGPNSVGPGAVLAIPAEYRYSLRSTAGCVFLNYRRDAVWMTASPSVPPVLESIHHLEEFGAALAAG